MKKQKIGIDIRAIGQQRTGDENYTLNLVREILKIDQENQYFLLIDSKETQKIERKIFYGIKNTNAKIVSVLPKFKLFWTFFLLPKIAQKLDLDILHVQYITPFWLPRKVKLITTIADVSFRVFPEFINKLDLFFLKILIPLSLKRADKIITVSDFTKNEIVKYYGIEKAKITAIHNGQASEVFFSKKIKNKKQTLSEFGIKEPYLFYVGTHQPRKDIPTLMRAFFDFKAENPEVKEIKNLQLVIGGKIRAHNYDLRIDKILEETKNNFSRKEFLNDIIFTGYINDEDLVNIYRAANVFVAPSLYEGFGLSLIEAMSLGVPVIASDTECFREIAGDAAEFYKPKDAKSLQKALLEVIMKPEVRSEMVQKGVKNSQRYSWSKTAQETLRVFFSK